jgi:hypothetical protein
MSCLRESGNSQSWRPLLREGRRYVVAGSHPLHDASRQIPLQRLGTRFVICKNISRPFCDSRMSFVACEVPDSLLAEKRAFGADHVRRHLVPPLARERRQRVDVEGVRPTGARM